MVSCVKNGESSMAQEHKGIELLNDTSFEEGFDLLTTSTNNGRALSGVLNYGGEAKGDSRSWQLSQWWTHNDFINSEFTKLDTGKYEYKNDSRTLTVDQANNSVTLDLNSYVEYMTLLGHSRTGSEQWSHMLIEQSFKNPAKLSDLSHLYVYLEFTLNIDENLDPNQAIPCSQISWYFTVTDVKNGDPTYESGKGEGKDNDFFWFGLPLYDSRYDFVGDYAHVDKGFTGATNKLIYTYGSKNFLPEKVKIGKQYSVFLDILPIIKDAYIYGLQNGAMENSNWTDLFVNYMNLGWELPGSYHSSITIKNLSIKAVEKEFE
jgi:hypothetical protein